MEITLNNRKEIIEKESVSVSDLIKLKNYTFKLLVTKVNGKLVKKEQRDKIRVQDGDNVVILHMISGG